MWSINEKQRKVFFKILKDYESNKTSFNFNKILKTPLRFEDGKEGLTVNEVIENKTVSFDEIYAINQILPPDLPFFLFVDILEPSLYTDTLPSKNLLKQKEIYQARIQRLKEEQENREYFEMTKTIDLNYGAKKSSTLNLGQELQNVNRQIIVVFNTMLTVGGAFVFGFYGIDMAYPNFELNLPTKLVLGLFFGTIVFFADVYFIIKNME